LKTRIHDRAIQNYHAAPVVRCEIGFGDLLLDLEPGLISHSKTDRMSITNVPLCHQSLSLKYHVNMFGCACLGMVHFDDC
jgi:hypothetical protein